MKWGEGKLFFIGFYGNLRYYYPLVLLVHTSLKYYISKRFLQFINSREYYMLSPYFEEETDWRNKNITKSY